MRYFHIRAFPGGPRALYTAMAVAIAATALTACTAGPGAAPGVSKAQVAAIEVTLTETLRLVKLYTDLPVCPAPAPCSVPGTRVTLITDSHAAYGAFKRLQATPSDITLAATQVALDLLRNETPVVPAKP